MSLPLFQVFKPRLALPSRKVTLTSQGIQHHEWICLLCDQERVTSRLQTCRALTTQQE